MPPRAGDRVFAGGPVRVAAWNIRLEPVSRRLDSLVKSIWLIDADILLLIEFTPDNDLPALQRALRTAGIPYNARLVTARSKQNLVYLVRPGIKELRQEAWTDMMLGNDDHRPGLMGSFRAGEFDFTVVGVHLKSKRGGESETDAIRSEQLTKLIPRLKRAQKRDPDLLLIGDYNMIRDEDKPQFGELAKAGLTMLHHERLAELEDQKRSNPNFEFSLDSYLTKNGGSLIDGYAISIDAEQELIPDSFQVLPLHERLGIDKDKFRRQYSDHLPLVAEFDTTTDHDP